MFCLTQLCGLEDIVRNQVEFGLWKNRRYSCLLSKTVLFPETATDSLLVIDCIGIDCIGIDCIGIDCIGIDCIGIDCIGMDCIGIDCIGIDYIGIDCIGRDCN